MQMENETVSNPGKLLIRNMNTKKSSNLRVFTYKLTTFSVDLGITCSGVIESQKIGVDRKFFCGDGLRIFTSIRSKM